MTVLASTKIPAPVVTPEETTEYFGGPVTTPLATPDSLTVKIEDSDSDSLVSGSLATYRIQVVDVTDGRYDVVGEVNRSQNVGASHNTELVGFTQTFGNLVAGHHYDVLVFLTADKAVVPAPAAPAAPAH